jgi:predicted TIM-barrel fold metal-dependent hydrolase
MKLTVPGAVDCDLHPAAPPMSALLPYLSEYWSDQLHNRFIDKFGFTMTSHNPLLAVHGRPDWQPKSGLPGSDFELMRTQALDAFGSSYSICNVLHGAVALFHGDMAASILGALNDWVAKELLPRDPRLRGSISITLQDPKLAVAEIERCADNPAFVQVLLPALGELPIGRRIYWPVFETAQRAKLPICLHAGSLYRHAPMGSGWPSYFVEDYVTQSTAFEGALVSLLAEGVFRQFPDLTFVLAESGVTWLPQFLWRQDKMWLGVRTELPWIDRVPREIVRERVRMTLQPFDAPSDPKIVQRIVEHFESDDVLLFSTDYPHWHFDDDDVIPHGFSPDLVHKIAVENPRATYSRLPASVKSTMTPEVSA